MVQFLPIRSLEAGNGNIDFSPLGNALSEFGKVRRDVEATNYARQQAEEEKRYSRGRAGAGDHREKIKQLGDAAFAISQMDDGDPVKQYTWKSWLNQHGTDGLTPEELDWKTGPRIAAAAAGKYLDPNKAAMDKAELEFKQAQTQALREKQNDPVEQYLLQRLQGLGKPAPVQAPAAPAPQQPTLQPQSFNQAPQPMPGVTLAADQPQAQPPQQAAPIADEIDTPYGRMSREEARQLGGSMLLSPKYSAAGRALLDSVEKVTGAGADLGKAAVNQLQERTINAAANLARLGDIEKRFNPQFLEIPTRLNMIGASWGAKLGPELGGKIAPEIQKQLSDYSGFRSAAVNNLNTILKELSGAAVTPQEFERIQADQPTAGTGILDGDDPVSFQAKMKRSTQSLKAAIARYNYLLSNGVKFDAAGIDRFMRLDDVPAAIDKRGAEIEQQLRQSNPNADPSAIQGEVAKRLKQEFGI